MFDRYDPRSDNGRDRGDSWDRSFGSRGGAGERDREEQWHDVFTRNLDLPRGRVGQVRDRDRVYEIDGGESRALATIGAFRVVAESDLHDVREDAQGSKRSLKHLENEGLIRTSPLRSDDRSVTLTDLGRDLLEANRCERDDRIHRPRQMFYAGLRKPRELTHDTNVYRAYLRGEERLRGEGGRVCRVVLDYELKRDYQKWLHERDRDRDDYDGHPDRDPHQIEEWAREHELPYFDDQVHFPDARIQDEDRRRPVAARRPRDRNRPLSRRPRRRCRAGQASAAIAPSAAWSVAARALAGEEARVTRGLAEELLG